jgi:hypothetical protein
VLAVLWYGLERSGPNPLARRAAAVLGLALGGLLFAGSLAEGGHEGWPGIVAGVACAALAWASVGALLSRAGERLRRSGAGEGMLSLYGEGAALALTGLAIALPPVSFVALIAFVVLLVRSSGEGERKYAGLRILR